MRSGQKPCAGSFFFFKFGRQGFETFMNTPIAAKLTLSAACKQEAVIGRKALVLVGRGTYLFQLGSSCLWSTRGASFLFLPAPSHSRCTPSCSLSLTKKAIASPTFWVCLSIIFHEVSTAVRSSRWLP